MDDNEIKKNPEKENQDSSKNIKPSRGKTKKKKNVKNKRTRVIRPYPVVSFEDALPLAEAIQKYASGEKVRRLTLFKQLNRSLTSSTTQTLITNSAKYGLTSGSYVADWLELTEQGKLASGSEISERDKRTAQFKLAIENIPPYSKLYSEYKGKKLPTHDVLKDMLLDPKLNIEKPSECVDLFIVNIKYLGMLQTIAGSETLVPIEQVLDEIGGINHSQIKIESKTQDVDQGKPQKINWQKTCFIITPIGEENSETRKHADLFQSSLIEPALKEFDLVIVRADKIGSAGMITSQIIEYVIKSKLCIVDLSFHNPNAFYEMAIRHACKNPVIQIIRKQDRLPFDVNQVRTVVIDTTDIYSLIPKLETYRSEIATQARTILVEGAVSNNPISVFFPGFEVVLPK